MQAPKPENALSAAALDGLATDGLRPAAVDVASVVNGQVTVANGTQGLGMALAAGAALAGKMRDAMVAPSLR